MKRKEFNEKMRTLELIMSDYRKATKEEINESWPARLRMVSVIATELAYQIDGPFLNLFSNEN